MSPWRRVALAALIAVSIGSGAVALAVFRRTVILLLLGLVVAELLEAIAAPFHRRFGGRRGIWLGLAVLVVLGAVAGLIAVSSYPLGEQLSSLFSDLPRILRALVERVERWDRRLQVAPGTLAADLEDFVSKNLSEITVGAGAVAVSTLEGVSQALAVVFLGVFVAAAPRTHKELFLRFFPERSRGLVVIHAAREALHGYLAAVSLSMMMVGALVTAGLWVIGVPYFLVWGVLAGAMELVPYVGPVIALSCPAALCLATDPPKAVWVAGFYVLVHGLEANVIVPLAVRKRAHVPPSVVIVTLLILDRLAGILGLIAAAPVAAVVVTVWRAVREPRVEVVPTRRAAA